jgi:hypothetical protein
MADQWEIFCGRPSALYCSTYQLDNKTYYALYFGDAAGNLVGGHRCLEDLFTEPNLYVALNDLHHMALVHNRPVDMKKLPVIGGVPSSFLSDARVQKPVSREQLEQICAEIQRFSPLLLPKQNP